MERTHLGYKLIFTVVKKGHANKVIKAAKLGGADGATTMLGMGTAPPGTDTFWGLDLSPEKEVVMVMTPPGVSDIVFANIRRIAKLDKHGSGISIMIDMLHLAGCVHLGRNVQLSTRKPLNAEIMQESTTYDLIVTIIDKGFSGEVLEASRAAGAEGGTIMVGRGSGIHEKGSLFSINIEPEKEIILTLVSRDITENVLNSIVERTELNKPGKGIAFVLEVDKAAGIAHKATV
jgi:nitrogen regulatory protein PII